MNKRQLIEDIRKHNITAQPQFLEQFDEEALAEYLRHLEEASQKRMRFAGWVRSDTKLRMVS
jgi:hypothetical protein